MSTRACQAVDKSKCPFPGHGSKVRREEEAQRDLRKKLRALEENQKQTVKHGFILDDIAKNSQFKTLKNGEKSVSVFRSGIPNPPTNRGIEKKSYEVADSYITNSQRDGRMNAVFSSPSLNGVTRWVQGNEGIIDDLSVREMKVNPDEVFVYKVSLWEKASRSIEYEGRHDPSVAVKEYWDSGITLTQWFSNVQTDKTYDPTDWEILLPEKKIKSVKSVGTERVVQATYDDDIDSHDEGDSFWQKNVREILKKDARGKKFNT